MKHYYALLFLYMLHRSVSCSEIKPREKDDARQMQYISLINSLLKQTNLLSVFDGALLAATTYVASALAKLKPVMMVSVLSYLFFVALAILAPGLASQYGLPTMKNVDSKFSARSSDSDSIEHTVLDNNVAEFMRTFQMNPVTTVITNVTISVLNSTMSGMQAMSKLVVKQLSAFQGNMSYFSKVISNECVSKFLCRVGQMTEVNFPMMSSLLRSLSNSYPGMDEFAVAVVRGTSSTNCSLIYPDCTL